VKHLQSCLLVIVIVAVAVAVGVGAPVVLSAEKKVYGELHQAYHAQYDA